MTRAEEDKLDYTERLRRDREARAHEVWMETYRYYLNGQRDVDRSVEKAEAAVKLYKNLFPDSAN